MGVGSRGVQAVSFIGGSGNIDGLATSFHHPFGGPQALSQNTEVVELNWIAPRAGILSNLRSAVKTALGAAETIVLTVRVNAADSILAVTHPNNAVAGSKVTDTDQVAVAAGDNITIKAVSTDNANNFCNWTLDFTPT